MEATVRKPPLQFPSSFIPSKPAGSGRQRTSKDQRFTSPLFLLAGCLEQKDVGFLLIKPLFGHLQEPGECPYQSHQGMACSRWHDGCLVLPSSQGPGRKTKRTFHVRVGQSTAVQIIEEMHHRRFLEIGQCPFNRPVIGGRYFQIHTSGAPVSITCEHPETAHAVQGNRSDEELSLPQYTHHPWCYPSSVKYPAFETPT